ncbi:MAG: TIGR00730 family Rossman fold protein [Alphaproteobacteria bacterium]
MAQVRSLCVYCGSRIGRDPSHAAAAAALGEALARRGITLVYGGGRVGLMGVMADACLAAGGRVVGIIPRHLYAWEVGHDGVSELLVVENMHTRKRLMVERSDAVAVLPGALGTLDETLEMATWRQVGLHDLPIVVVDVAGYWQPLLHLVRHAVAEGYVDAQVAAALQFVGSVDELFAALDAAPPPRFAFEDRWA